MRLVEYLAEQELTLTAFGRKIGRGPETVRRYCLGPDNPDYRIPDRAGMKAIYLATGGKVTPNDFHDLPDLPKPKDLAAGGKDG